MNTEIAIQLTNESYTPEELLTPERNKKTTREFLSRPSLNTVGKYGEFTIFSVMDSAFGGRFFVIEDDLIKYYVRYEALKFVPLHSLCQVGVWRDKDFTPMERDEGPTMAAHVFQKILLKKFGEVISDKIQTDFGRYFWIRQVQWALIHNKFVYFLRLSGEEVGKVLEIVRIRDKDHFKELKSSAWGRTLKDQRIRLLISEKPVLFPDKDTYKQQKESVGVK